MFLRRLLKGSAVAGVGLLLVCLVMGSTASASESYSFSRQISGLNAPLDVAVGPDGTAYIADQSNFRVVQYNEYGVFANQCSFQSTGYLPIALAVDPDGEVYYVTRFGNGMGDVIRFGSPNTCDFSEVGTPASGLYYGGVAIAPDGSVFVSDFYNDSISKFGPDGSFIKSWGEQGNGYPDPDICSSTGGTIDCGVQFLHPMGLAVLPYGGANFLLVADSGNNRIQLFDLDGNFIGVVGSLGTGQWQFNSPDGIAVGPDGNVYISDTGNKRIEKVSIPDGALSQIGDASSLSSPQGLSVDDGGNVYVADSDYGRVAVFTPNIVVFDNGAASKTITGNQPFSVTLALNPDKYWNGAVSELYLWVEYQGVKAYWAGLPLNLVGFSSLSQMKPLASGIPIPNVPAFTWTVLNDSSVLPAGTYTLHLCLDRDVNGTFNPSASVCGSINVVRQ